MKFKEFMELYDNWNGFIKVNDDNCDIMVFGRTYAIMDNHSELFEMEVVSFGFYDDELCVRVR